MKGQNVGYIRVSSIDQNTSRQLDGIELDTTFEDHCSGKDTNRPQLEACLLEHLPNASELIKKIEPLLNTPDLNPIFLSIKYKELRYSKRLVIVVFECKKTKK